MVLCFHVCLVILGFLIILIFSLDFVDKNINSFVSMTLVSYHLALKRIHKESLKNKYDLSSKLCYILTIRGTRE